MKRATPEADIQRAIVKLLRAVIPAPGIVHASGHEQRGHGKAALLRQAQLKAMGTLAGFPDLIVIADGVTVFLEVKAPGGSLSQSQRDFREAMQSQGIAWALVRSPADALEAVRAAGISTAATTWQPVGAIAKSLARRAGMCQKKSGPSGATNANPALTITDLASGGQDGC